MVSQLALLDSVSRALLEYASNNYLRTFSYDSNGYDYNTHFNVVLKAKDTFLSIESVSSTYKSYVFVSKLDTYKGDDYIEWHLFLNNEAPEKIQELLQELNSDTATLQEQIKGIIDSEYFNDTSLSYEEKKELVFNFLKELV